jgi:predicted SprT family Zn-dependent metalloprotease
MDTKTLFKPWQDALALWPQLHNVKAPTFKVSNRMTRCAGLCYVETGEITLSGLYLAKYPDIMLGEILAHETAHYIDYALNGWQKYKRHHGKPWQEIMYNLGFNPEPYHTMEL